MASSFHPTSKRAPEYRTVQLQQDDNTEQETQISEQQVDVNDNSTDVSVQAIPVAQRAHPAGLHSSSSWSRSAHAWVLAVGCGHDDMLVDELCGAEGIISDLTKIEIRIVKRVLTSLSALADLVNVER